MKPVLAITPGDPSGIGPEIIVKSLARIRSFCRPLLYCSPELLEKRGSANPDHLTGLDFREPEATWLDEPGVLSSENGIFSAEAIRMAVDDCLAGNAAALVTGPISKKAWELAGIEYPGHTEMLRDLAHVPRTMMLFYTPAFSVILHTIHIPLMRVCEAITESQLLEGIRFADDAIRSLTGEKKEFRVCGLNPHAGEQGRLGSEDFAIEKAVQALKKEQRRISGPYPADTLFSHIPQDGRIVVYAMYHDQGLVPIKTMYPVKCVNITLGLPFLRASVSHGTAFDIAGKQQADHRNFIETVKTTVQLLGRCT